MSENEMVKTIKEWLYSEEYIDNKWRIILEYCLKLLEERNS